MNKQASTNDSNQSIQTDDITLKELIIKVQEWWKYLLSKWLIILMFGILGGAVGLAYGFTQKWNYIARLSFALEDESGGAGGLGGALGLASQFGFDLGGQGGGAFAGDNLLELMKSRSMIEKALLTTVKINGKEQTLAELYIDFNEMRKDWKEYPDLKGIKFLPDADRSKFTLKQDSILGQIYDKLVFDGVTVDKLNKKLSIIVISVTSKNELFSKYFAEVLSREVSNFYVETKTKKSAENLAILQHQTDSVRRALTSAITGVARSLDLTPNANASRQILRVPSQARQVDVQANMAILQELVKNLEVSKVALRREKPLIQIIDKPILPLAKKKLGKAKALVVGGFIGGFLIVFFLILKKLLREL